MRCIRSCSARASFRTPARQRDLHAAGDAELSRFERVAVAEPFTAQPAQRAWLDMLVFDVHLHIQPWEMVKPDVLALIDDPSHAGREGDPLVAGERAALSRRERDRARLLHQLRLARRHGLHARGQRLDREFHARASRSPAAGRLGESAARDATSATRSAASSTSASGMIKIHPPHQLFSPNAYKRGELWQLAEIYRECEERGVPVMFHTGTSIFPKARNVFADPMPIDDVAIDFPRLHDHPRARRTPAVRRDRVVPRAPPSRTSTSISPASRRSRCRATSRASRTIADKVAVGDRLAVAGRDLAEEERRRVPRARARRRGEPPRATRERGSALHARFFRMTWAAARPPAKCCTHS